MQKLFVSIFSFYLVIGNALQATRMPTVSIQVAGAASLAASAGIHWVVSDLYKSAWARYSGTGSKLSALFALSMVGVQVGVTALLIREIIFGTLPGKFYRAKSICVQLFKDRWVTAQLGSEQVFFDTVEKWYADKPLTLVSAFEDMKGVRQQASQAIVCLQEVKNGSAELADQAELLLAQVRPLIDRIDLFLILIKNHPSYGQQVYRHNLMQVQESC